MLTSNTNAIIDMLALKLISIKCFTSRVNVELPVSDTRAPAVSGTKNCPRVGQEHEQWRELTTAVGESSRPPVIRALLEH